MQSDTTALDRSAKNVVSFAPVLKKIVPCVVTVSTTRKMGDPSRRGSPFDDPTWRRFFGLEEEDDKPATGERLRSSVKIVLGNDVRVDTFGLKAKLGGDVTVLTQPGDVARGLGAINVIEGQYKAFGQDVTITRGRRR